jgi:hypothetical protein
MSREPSMGLAAAASAAEPAARGPSSAVAQQQQAGHVVERLLLQLRNSRSPLLRRWAGEQPAAGPDPDQQPQPANAAVEAGAGTSAATGTMQPPPSALPVHGAGAASQLPPSGPPQPQPARQAAPTSDPAPFAVFPGPAAPSSTAAGGIATEWSPGQNAAGPLGGGLLPLARAGSTHQGDVQQLSPVVMQVLLAAGGQFLDCQAVCQGLQHMGVPGHSLAAMPLRESSVVLRKVSVRTWE